ncbi:MAG: DUF3943 domain-containing protein [Spirochaetaceae bacterium]|nr:DUF3943 domain-containing protein [Spirochaetaceae bacterium]
MKKTSLITIALFFGTVLYGQEAAENKPGLGGFFLATGENILSNTLLYLANRYIAHEAWAQVDGDSIRDNITGGWEWDHDEYFTNQFGHPYQGSVYHTAARSNGFGFYQAALFDIFGSLSWEIVFETNMPSINDLISTTLGGAALGEMFHRLYKETAGPFVVLVSPIDTINGPILSSGRKNQHTNNIYALKFAAGVGYTYAGQSSERKKYGGTVNLSTLHVASTDLTCTVVYGDPFVQHSVIPYNHFELLLYANLGLPFWYNLKLLSDAYMVSFSVIDTENRRASTGLTMHYDLFTDRHIDFFSQAFDWTYKHSRSFQSGVEMEFRGHVGWTVLGVDAFCANDEYPGLRKTENNYGTGLNIKLIFSVKKPRYGSFELKAYTYEIFNIFRNGNMDTGADFFMFFAADYYFPLWGNTVIGIASSSLWYKSVYDSLPDRQRLTHDAKLYIAWVK